jgi:hypothetical protein
MPSKQQLLLQECVYPYHHMFKNDEVKKHLVKHEKTLASMAQKLTEEAMAHASKGRYKWTDDDGEDYDDGSDQKTGTMKPTRPHGGGMGEIAGLSTDAGHPKNGAIRAIIHNQHTKKLDYFYFPKSLWYSQSTNAPNGKLRLRFSYSGITNEYVWWAEQYRVNTFVELSKITKEDYA